MQEVNINQLTNEIQYTLKQAETASATPIPEFDVEAVSKAMRPQEIKPKRVSNDDIANMLVNDVESMLGGLTGNKPVRNVGMDQMTDMEIHNQFVAQAEQEAGYDTGGFMGELTNGNKFDQMHQQMTQMQERYNNPEPQLLFG